MNMNRLYTIISLDKENKTFVSHEWGDNPENAAAQVSARLFVVAIIPGAHENVYNGSRTPAGNL